MDYPSILNEKQMKKVAFLILLASFKIPYLAKRLCFFHFGAFLGRSCHVAFCRLLECDESLFVGFPKSVNPFAGTCLPKPTFLGRVFMCDGGKRWGSLFPFLDFGGKVVKEKHVMEFITLRHADVHHPNCCNTAQVAMK